MRVLPLELATVRLPETHPRADDGGVVVRGFAIDHPDGVVLVDTGVGQGHPVIDELYSPTVVPLIDALTEARIDERDVVAVVNTHLHFDHCGQNHVLPDAPVWVQREEYALVNQPGFTVAEWASIEDHRLRLADGDVQLADAVRLVSTPGHTPGHQSVMVEDAAGSTLIGGQCCWTIDEFKTGQPLPADMHSSDWITVGKESVARLRALKAHTVLLSHDRRALRRQ